MTGYFEYEERFMEFVKAFYKTGLMASNYQEELERRVPNWQTKNISRIVETADFELTKIILTKAIRVERFCEGTWYDYIKSGFFLDILRRLNELSSID